MGLFLSSYIGCFWLGTLMLRCLHSAFPNKRDIVWVEGRFCAGYLSEREPTWVEGVPWAWSCWCWGSIASHNWPETNQSGASSPGPGATHQIEWLIELSLLTRFNIEIHGICKRNMYFVSYFYLSTYILVFFDKNRNKYGSHPCFVLISIHHVLQAINTADIQKTNKWRYSTKSERFGNTALHVHFQESQCAALS